MRHAKLRLRWPRSREKLQIIEGKDMKPDPVLLEAQDAQFLSPLFEILAEEEVVTLGRTLCIGYCGTSLTAEERTP